MSSGSALSTLSTLSNPGNTPDEPSPEGAVPPSTAANYFSLQPHTPNSFSEQDSLALHATCVRPAARNRLSESALAQRLLVLVIESCKVQYIVGAMVAGAAVINEGDVDVRRFSRGADTLRWQDTLYQIQLRNWYFEKTGRMLPTVGHYKPDENRRLRVPYRADGEEEYFADIFGHLGERKSVDVDEHGRPAADTTSLRISVITSTSSNADRQLPPAQLRQQVAVRIARQRFIKFQQSVARTAVYLTTAFEYGGTFLGIAQSGTAFSRMVYADIEGTNHPHIVMDCSDSAFERLQSTSTSTDLPFILASAVDLLDNEDNVDMFASDLGKLTAESLEVDRGGVETYIQLHRLSTQILLRTPMAIPLPRLPPPALPDFLAQHLDVVNSRPIGLSMKTPRQRFEIALRGRDTKDLKFPTSVPATPADQRRQRSPPSSGNPPRRSGRVAAQRLNRLPENDPTLLNATGVIPEGDTRRPAQEPRGGEPREDLYQTDLIPDPFYTPHGKSPRQKPASAHGQLTQPTVQSSTPATTYEALIPGNKGSRSFLGRLDTRPTGRPRSHSLDVLPASSAVLLSDIERSHTTTALNRSGPPYVQHNHVLRRPQTLHSPRLPLGPTALSSRSVDNLLEPALSHPVPIADLSETNLDEFNKRQGEETLSDSHLIDFLASTGMTFIFVKRHDMTRYFQALQEQFST